MAVQKVDADEEFLDHFWMSDEAHFHLNGYVNSQNCCVWATENPKVCVQSALYSQKTTVWCAISRSGIIGPFFFHETINQQNYREMIVNQFIPELQ